MHSILSSPFASTNNILVTNANLNLCCATVLSGFVHEAALSTITASDYEVTGFAQVQFVAEGAVTLQPGFSATPGNFGQFRARINRFCDGDFPAGVPINSLASGGTNWAHYHLSSSWNEAVTAPTLFPNPVTDRLTLRWSDQDFAVQVFAATGQLVWESQAKAHHQTEIDVSALPPGTYFCHMQSETGPEIVKFNKL